MNRPLVASLLRELADAIEAPDEEAAKKKTGRKSGPRLVAPDGPVDELARARAERILHDRGYRRPTK